MLQGQALEIVLKMARSHLAFMADLADNFDMNSSDNRPFNTLEAEAIEEVELLSKNYEMKIKAMNPPSHWDEDEKYPVKDWQYEVANDYTRIGYLEWVEHRKEQFDDLALDNESYEASEIKK